MDLSGFTDKEIVQTLAQSFKTYRLHLNKTQKEVAEQLGLSVLTVSNFERGVNTEISLKNFIKLLRTVNSLENVQQILPEIPISPKQMAKMKGKLRQRSRKNKES